MASHMLGEPSKTTSSTSDDAFVFVFDRREGNSPELRIPTAGLFSFEDFKKKISEILKIDSVNEFVITTTNRELIQDDFTWDNIESGDTLYVLQNAEQVLSAPAQERVDFLPHYDTIVKGGMYEYYASEGQNPLPYAFAELIDNALAATCDNLGPRNIEIHLHFDETTPSKNCIFVLDNGKGMTSRQLNNWAIYRLSKFIRRDRRGKMEVTNTSASLEEEYPDNWRPPSPTCTPRSLNSDISYFGVGGKQAIFFIGNSTRMITKPKESTDVHELTISKEEFERKEKNNESIYSGYIRNRRPGDVSHLPADDEVIRKLIGEEVGKASFTAVVITGINVGLVPYLKSNIKDWTRQLAHIYHYYIHGPNGNVDPSDKLARGNSPFRNISIEVKLFTKGQSVPRSIHLNDFVDDMQTQYIRTAASQFEFKALVEGTGVVEGILRYHPFLYDRETYPADTSDFKDPDAEDDTDYTPSDLRPARGRRPIYECYWNGRLIPYTTIEEFEWCSVPKKSKSLPLECYNRISGVLWTNDKFQVSTNKLTFIDLEMKLREKNCVFARVIGGHDKRTDISKEFTNWLKECHQLCDKQVKFSQFVSSVVRSDLPKNRQSPWAVYKQIEWDGKIYKQGQMVRIAKTLPTLYGSIQRFLLFGDHDGDVFATGGDLEVVQEPRSLYDEVRIVPLSKLDRTTMPNMVARYIEEEEAKLPERLVVSWPEGDRVHEGESRPAGKTIGDIKVEISNRRGELISKLPGSNSQKKLLVELTVIWHSAHGDEVMVSHISQHGKNWPYWFRKMENIKNLGSHTLQLQVVLNESGASTYAGKELPSHKIRFTVTEAEPDKFTVGLLEGPFRIGSPFQIPLEFQDEFNHITKPSSTLLPVLEASGLELKYEGVQTKGNSLIIKGIVALGSVGSNQGKSFALTVRVPGLDEDSQSLKIRMLPGPPHSLHVQPEGDQIEVENGSPATFKVEVLDQAGNPTSQPKLVVVCKMSGASGLPTYNLDCSNIGHGTLTGDPVNLKKLSGTEKITAKIEIPALKNVKSVEKTIKLLPSSKASNIEVTYKKSDGAEVPIKSGQDVIGVAGEFIKGLKFRITDEAGREVRIDEKIAAKLKVNYTSKALKELIIKNELPDVNVPNLVSDSKYCHISLTDGSGLEFSFTARATAGEPATIKTSCAGSNKMRLGESLASDVLVSVTDKHANVIKKLTKEDLKNIAVLGDGLIEEETVRGLQQTAGFLIQGIRFDKTVSLGSREIEVRWGRLSDFLRLEIVAGPPSKLTIPGWDLSQPITMYNESRMPQPLVIQLCDEGGNPSQEANVRIQMAKDAGIKLSPAPMPIKSNNKGTVDFGAFIVSGKRGVYELQPKAFFGRTTISGPKIKISIQADMTKPVSLTVEYDKNASYTVSEYLPDFTVKVFSEDDNLMTTAKPSCLCMKLWKSEGLQSRPPDKAIRYTPDAKKKGDKEGIFSFSKRKIPEHSGTHNIMFIYSDGKHEIFSNQIAINVQPGPPAKLVALENPGTPTVSNTKNQASRSLIRSLKLELRDQHGNASGVNLAGKVQIEITHEHHQRELPQLVGNTSKLELPLNRGQVTLQNLVIKENSAGTDGQEYILRCQAMLSNNTKNKTIPPFDIPFLFYNDAEKQSQMSALTKERDSLLSAISTYKSLFDTTKQLIDELKISLHEAQTEESKIKGELRRLDIPASQLSSVSNIDTLIQARIKERDQILNLPRRLCGLQPAPRDPDVLGKIAHLAQVQQNAIARVLSWHMSADMDCVVTLTTRKAKDIYSQSSGKQQVLPLESIYKKNLPDWSKPLPHLRIRPNWRPPGNPVYARNLLTFPAEEEKCKIVFGMLLGDTIILDNLDAANAYRQEIVKATHCPTILTRDGDRIRSNGKFGGLMNKALPLEKLRGAVFSEPLPQKYRSICSQIEKLQTCREVMARRQNAEGELQEHINSMKRPEMQAKFTECTEAESQLKDIEAKIGMGSPSVGSRVRPADTSASDAPPAKKARTSAVNGNTPPMTPTRQSTRRIIPSRRM